MHSREKSQRPYFRITDPAMAASRTTGSRGFYPALTIPRLVIVIYALYGRSTSGSTRTVLNAVDHRGWSSHMATVLRITAYHAHTHTYYGTPVRTYRYDFVHTSTSMSSSLSLLAQERACMRRFNYWLFTFLSSGHYWLQHPRETAFSIDIGIQLLRFDVRYREIFTGQ